MTSARIQAILEAFAVGDALGMPTEFMTRDEIRARFGIVDRLLDPATESRNHADLRRGQVTDDTEQVLALLDEYLLRGRVDAAETAVRLVRWMRESGAIEKRYIGPSSRAALEAVEAGADPASTGLRGTTCGGVMRSPAAALYSLAAGLPLDEAVLACCLPTHNTSPALEAAMAYAYALRAAAAESGSAATTDSIIAEAAYSGAGAGRASAPYVMCGASLEARLRQFMGSLPGLDSADSILDFLYGVYGTGLESADVGTAALAIALHAGDDVWLALRLGASAGGDTDTVAALAGALCAARSGRHNIPADILAEVAGSNGLDLQTLSGRLSALGG